MPKGRWKPDRGPQVSTRPKVQSGDRIKPDHRAEHGKTHENLETSSMRPGGVISEASLDSSSSDEERETYSDGKHQRMPVGGWVKANPSAVPGKEPCRGSRMVARTPLAKAPPAHGHHPVERPLLSGSTRNFEDPKKIKGNQGQENGHERRNCGF